MTAEKAIPRYFLYGDQHSDVELDFIHVEPIRERSGQYDWTIRPHAHPDHAQILLVDKEGGEIRIEEKLWPISSPALVVIPAAMVHEIRFIPYSDGFAVTAATNYLNTITQDDQRLHEVLLKPAVYSLINTNVRVEGVTHAFEWMYREFLWSAPGRRKAIMAHLLRILVALIRLDTEQDHSDGKHGGRDYELVSRYRELLEQNFRKEKGLEFYAHGLGVSMTRLNLACKSKTGKTSSEILYERLVIEAKRYLIYSEMTVAEIGYAIGFEDPAYFSRFFSRRVGVPPGGYRQESAIQKQTA
ncbi:helix-turn-helix domain-containing protein [Sedimenticola sp.]|uniref:helix-turn-helix domain-containing protein n=1 Tax=Sedimenticola sp. TaxID=1940285 RepID=UPI003D104FD1